MCRFVMIGCSTIGPSEVVCRLLETHGRTFHPLGEDCPARRLVPEATFFGTTNVAECDCDTKVGISTRGGQYSAQDIVPWIEILRGLSDGKQGKTAWLLMHEFTGLIEAERFKLRGQESIAIEKVTPEMIAGIEEDVLYKFRKTKYDHHRRLTR